MLNGHRVIEIDDPQPSKIPEDVDWHETKQLPNGIEERWRDGPTIYVHRKTWVTDDIGYGNRTVFTEEYSTEPAEIEWSYIRAYCKVFQDDHHDAPWDACDGYEHGVVTFHDGSWRTSFSNSAGYYSPGSYQGEAGAIFIDDGDVDAWGVYDFYRERGASKQVARECEAANKRRTITRLARWYSEGWQWYAVSCEFLAGGETYEASIGGVDCYSYAETEISDEIADQVAYAVEEDGFTVVGRPKPPSRIGYYKDRYKHQIHMQDWDETI